MKIVKDETERRNYGLAGSADLTPYYFQKGNNKHFICNLITNINGTHNSLNHRQELAQKIKNLRRNNYKFICFYGGKFDNPFDLIKWVTEKDYSFQRHGEFFRPSKDGFVDFHGNLQEYSNAFMFRIYDPEILSQLKKKMKTQKVIIHY